MAEERTVVVRLAGGLGNQMFQYAMGRSFADRQGADFAIDIWSGFVRDVHYKRRFELGALPIVAQAHNWPSRLVLMGNFWNQITRVTYRFNPAGTWVLRPSQTSTLIFEREYRFNRSILDTQFHGMCWVRGYWQSPQYFDGVSDVIALELQPRTPEDIQTVEIGKEMANSESLAVGIRLYEEGPSPESNASLIKKPQDVQNAVDTFLDEFPSANVYIFCTHRADYLQQIRWPRNTKLITHEEGFGGTHNRMWMLTQCRHHLFTTSSFYWWGAWLSQHQYAGQTQRILAADNFLNVDAIPEGWQVF